MKKFSSFIVDKRKLLFVLYVIFVMVSALGLFCTNVNYDMSKYLPDNASTKVGMEVMSDEFGKMSSITVMLNGLKEEERLKVKAELEKLPNVSNVIYYENDENYQKDNHSKYIVNMDVDTYSSEATETLDVIKEKYKDRELAVAGAVVDNDLLVSTLMDEVPFIAVIAVAIVFIILFLLCNSWIEPFLYMLCIGVATLLNMGTNALLPSVSFMTFAVGALLQLGLSMDYSVMLMNRYSQEKMEDNNPASAMKKALTKSFGAISGSSVTTIVGLLVLIFMSFKIGQDLGIVLAKGVFISLLCIFTLLPGLVVSFDKVISKTHKCSLNPKVSGIVKFVTKFRYVILPLVIILVVLSCFVKDNLSISYIKMFDSPDQKAIEEAFGVENQTVFLYHNIESKENVEQYISWLEEQEEVENIQDYSNTIGKEFTYEELSDEMGFDKVQAKLMFQIYADSQNTSEYDKITLYDLIVFASEELGNNMVFREFIDKNQLQRLQESKKQMDNGKLQLAEAVNQLDEQERSLAKKKEQMEAARIYEGNAKVQIETGILQIAEARKQLEENAKMYTQAMDAEELAKVMEQDVSEVEQLLKLKRMCSIDVSDISITLEEFMSFLTNEIMENPVYSSVIDDGMKSELEYGNQEIVDNKGLMLGDKYNRMVITTNLESEGVQTFEFIEKMRNKGTDLFKEQIFFVGDSSMGYEMDEGFADELNFVTILTIIAIFIVVVITFRSVLSAAVLVVVIQSAVFITTAIVYVQGISVNYVALILVQCILMGATIDYGILFLSHYKEMRLTLDKKAAVVIAMNRSIKTILTSSLILIGSCLAVGLMMTQKIIAQTCSIIAIGTVCSVIMVICILPIIIYLMDRFMIKKKREDLENA